MPRGVGQKERPPTVLVTGGSRGIGRALCLEFGRAGWSVGVHYRERKSEAEATAALLRQGGGDATIYQADILEAAQVDLLIKDFIAAHGRLDVMICNAGMSSSRLLLRLTPEEWNDILATNLTGTFHCVRAAGKHMLEQGDGSIIVVGSYAGLHGNTGQSAYAASKAGLIGLVKSAALEWGRDNVRVNAVLPGRHPTELSSGVMPDSSQMNAHILRRSPALQEIVKSVLHLATLRDISGQVWNLDSRLV